jgi:hypothetical protein
MESSGGWQLARGQWLRAPFIVAEPDEIKARECLRKKQPKGNILSRKIVPETVIQILQMKHRRALRMGRRHSERRYLCWQAYLTYSYLR